MYVYAHWTSNGHHTLQAFNKPDRAADFAFAQITNYVAHEARNYGVVPHELTAVLTMLDSVKNDKTLEQVKKLIELYEEYCRHVLGQESPIHEIKDIPVVE